MFFLFGLLHRIKEKRRTHGTLANEDDGANTASKNGTDDQPAQPASKNRASFWFKIRLLAALLLTVFLETLDYTVVATTQPYIALCSMRSACKGTLLIASKTSLPHVWLSYIGTAYLLSSTVFLPRFASVADIFGRYPGLQISLLFSLVGSAISTGAGSMTMMLLGRGIAGIGAAGLMTIVRTTLSDSRSLDDSN